MERAVESRSPKREFKEFKNAALPAAEFQEGGLPFGPSFFLFFFVLVVRVVTAVFALDHGVFCFFGAVAAEDVGFDFHCRENEAICRRVAGNPFLFIHFEEVDGFLHLLLCVIAAASLQLAEVVAGEVDLAGEAVAVHAEDGEGAELAGEI